MMKENKTAQYNLRLNLSNPYHLKLYEHLNGIKGDMYKSKNDYMISKLYEGIFGAMDGLPDDKMKVMEERMIQRVTTEILRTLLAGMQSDMLQSSMPSLQVGACVSEKTEDSIDEEVTNAALGYFDDWSEEEDE